jgi:hypothetical protein
MRRYGLHTESFCPVRIVIVYQFVSFARFEAAFCTVKKTYNK